MALYNAFSSYVERMAFKHATVRNVNDDSVDITVDEQDWDNIDWRYHCQGGFVPETAKIPYKAGQTVEIEWDTFNEEPVAVVGFPDGANQCNLLAMLLYTNLGPPLYLAYKLEAWINGDPIVVSYWESDQSPIDPPRNYRLIVNDIAIAYSSLDTYPGITGSILDIQFAENYPYRIAVLLDRKESPYAEEGEEMIYKYLVLIYEIDPVTLELGLETYYGLQTGPVGCKGGCSDADLEKNNPWCPNWTCECPSTGSRIGCFGCSTQYYYSYDIYSPQTNTNFRWVDQMSSNSSGSCGSTCCGDCSVSYLPIKIHLKETGDPTVFATGLRNSHVYVMPGGTRTQSYTWNHPVTQTNLDSGETIEGGIYETYSWNQSFNVTQTERCYKANTRVTWNKSGYYIPNTDITFNHSYDSGTIDSQYGVGNCYNGIGNLLRANLVRVTPELFDCSYAHNLIGDYYKDFPYIEIRVTSQLASGPAGERACLSPVGVLCGVAPNWSAFYSIYLVLTDDSYYYGQYERYNHVDGSSDTDPYFGQYLSRLFTMTQPTIQNISPRWSLHIERPDAALVWARTTISSEIFKSYTTAFSGSVQEIRCKSGQSNPNCSHLVEQADIDAGMNYYQSEIGEEREWHLLVSPSKAGWIISFQRTGILDFEFKLYGFTDLEEDSLGSGLIVHSGIPVWSKGYESTFLEPKGHAVCVYTP